MPVSLSLVILDGTTDEFSGRARELGLVSSFVFLPFRTLLMIISSRTSRWIMLLAETYVRPTETQFEGDILLDSGWRRWIYPYTKNP